MNCILSLGRAARDEASLPEHDLRKPLAQRARNRRAAVLYLQAAAVTDEPAERESLRRRAAELILPRVLSAVGHLERGSPAKGAGVSVHGKQGKSESSRGEDGPDGFMPTLPPG